jgi:hypothetical protein
VKLAGDGLAGVRGVIVEELDKTYIRAFAEHQWVCIVYRAYGRPPSQGKMV